MHFDLDWTTVWAIATQIGIVGAFMLLSALGLLLRGEWAPKSVINDLKAQVVDTRAERDEARAQVEEERLQHKRELAEWQKRTFNALGVTEKVLGLTIEHAAEEHARPPTRRSASGR